MISIISSAGVTDLLLYASAVSDVVKWNTTTKLLVVIFIVVVGSVFPAVIANSIGNAYYNRQSKIFEKQVELQAKHYEEMTRNNFELRRFKHDYKNMLIGVQELLQEGNTDRALELLRRGNGSIADSTPRGFETGNGIVDTILSEKQREADFANTVIAFDGALPTDKIAPTDLCVIFGNTLDNAIEACKNLSSEEEKQIEVSCQSAGGFLFVHISNPVRENVPISHNTVKTTKQNQQEHGFGLYSLHQSIRKYHGTLKLTCVDRVFSVELELELPNSA